MPVDPLNPLAHNEKRLTISRRLSQAKKEGWTEEEWEKNLQRGVDNDKIHKQKLVQHPLNSLNKYSPDVILVTWDADGQHDR